MTIRFTEQARQVTRQVTPRVTRQVARQAGAPMRFFHERYYGRPCCPKCGEPMMAAEYPQFFACHSGDVIRNFWRCDNCDHRFDTMVKFKPLAA